MSKDAINDHTMKMKEGKQEIKYVCILSFSVDVYVYCIDVETTQLVWLATL